MFLLFSKKSKSEKINCFPFEGVKVREDWLVLVDLFYKESTSKKRGKYFFFFLSLFFFFFWGGGGGGLRRWAVE